MIVERRAYQVGSGHEQDFWSVQRDWFWPPEIGDYFRHLIGYFETVSNGPREIVHLYRYESLAEWEQRYRGLYQRFPPHMFTIVRKYLTAQETGFMTPAMVDLPTIPALEAPVGPPRDYSLYGNAMPQDLVVQEVITDFLPGGLFMHWDAMRALPAISEIMRRNLIGAFHATTGRLHRKYEYRWFNSREDAAAHELAFAGDEAAATLTLASEPLQVGRAITYLKPAPFAWLRPLFEPMNWEGFDARDRWKDG